MQIEGQPPDIVRPIRDWPRLMSVSLAADYFSISAASLRILPIETIRIGRRVLYDRRALDRYADSLSGLEIGGAAGAARSPAGMRKLEMAEEERQFFAKRRKGI